MALKDLKDSSKIILLSGIIIVAVSYAVYSIVTPVHFDTNDSMADFAAKWLRAADRRPEAVKKWTVNSSNWFETFIRNRRSLGELRQRDIVAKQLVGKGKKTVTEILFHSSFERARKIDEIVRLVKEGEELRVAGVSYRYRWFPRLRRGDELKFDGKVDHRKIIQLARKCSDSYDARRWRYFAGMAAEHNGQAFINLIKKKRNLYGMPSTRRQVRIVYRNGLPGITTLELAAVINRISCNIRGQKRSGVEIITLRKDNSTGNVAWAVCDYNIFVRRVRKRKK